MPFGAECYLDCKREGFTGQIKQTHFRWQDFVVTEIDQKGQLVELVRGNIPFAREEQQKPLREKKDLTVQGKEKPRKKKIDEESDSSFLNQISDSFEMLKDVALKDLTVNLGSSRLQELTEFALLVENNRESDQKLCIGSELSKEERTSLHRSVRLTFPHLKTETIRKAQEGQVPAIFASNDKVYWEFCSLLNDRHQVDRLLCFAHWENRRKPTTLNLNVSGADKEQRTKIHRLLSKHFGSFLESKTFSNGDNNKHSSTRSGESYIQIRMRAKGTKETLEAIQRLSTCLDVQPSAFSYAGIKDKKAVTTQHVVVRGISPEQMCAIEGHPSLKGIKIGSYRGRVSGPLRMGGLSGNHFKVVVRKVQCRKSHARNQEECTKNIQEAVSSLSFNGFLNYFGAQRFGMDDKEVNACDIGLAMLQGNMVRAVKLLLTPSDYNPDHDVNCAKRYFCETGDVQGALAKMPAYKIREILVLKALHRRGTDTDGCRKALLNVPYSMRLLFVHSYCSLVWNMMASYRIQHYGREEASKGDLIVDPPTSTHDLDREAAGNGDCGGFDSCGDENSGIRRDRVRCIANHEQGKYSLVDVVLPLPGYGVQYPANDVGEMLRGLGINVPGAYRKLVAFPAELNWNHVKDADCHLEPGESSGLSENGSKRLRLNADSCPGDEEKQSFRFMSKAKENSTMAQRHDSNCCNDVELSFRLRPSCYATSCIRELLKS
ncbi:Pseudouridylate synthase PUS7L [Acropora cervicornis]|uniref:Pseudouridylate synthase PUS7L n=1 Tax=Acropora cervicornis TaxID=6130 RepID=A0AAD9QTC4_ACRCE|nr:Pseudouridylate synthase PUS7L [Acropora cervicornis]